MSGRLRQRLPLIVVLVAAPAFAQSARERAREAYERGTAAHKRGDFAQAAADYALADEIAPSPVALRAAIDEAVRADDAAVGMELVTRAARGPAEGELAASVTAARLKFQARAGVVRVRCPSGCMATLDGKPVDVKKDAWATLGQHTVVVQVGDDTQQRLVEVKLNAPVEVTAAVRAATPSAAGHAAPPEAPRQAGPAAPTSATAPAPASAAPPSAAPTSAAPASAAPASAAPASAAPGASSASSARPASAASSTAATEATARGGLSPVWFFVGAGATLALGAGTIWSALDTSSRHDDFVRARCDQSGSASCDGASSSGASAEARTNVLIAATAVVGVATVVIGLAFTRWSRGPARAARAGAGHFEF